MHASIVDLARLSRAYLIGQARYGECEAAMTSVTKEMPRPRIADASPVSHIVRLCLAIESLRGLNAKLHSEDIDTAIAALAFDVIDTANAIEVPKMAEVTT